MSAASVVSGGSGCMEASFGRSSVKVLAGGSGSVEARSAGEAPLSSQRRSFTGSSRCDGVISSAPVLHEGLSVLLAGATPVALQAHWVHRRCIRPLVLKARRFPALFGRPLLGDTPHVRLTCSPHDILVFCNNNGLRLVASLYAI